MMIEEAVLGETLDSKLGMEESSDELDDTLSLCDLPFYSNNQSGVDDDQWDDQDYYLSSGDESCMPSSSQHDHDDYFEFLSQDLTPSPTAVQPPANIIFCGKLIACKQPPPNTPTKEEHTPKIKKRLSSGRWDMFGWGKCSDSKNSGKKSTTTLKHNEGQNSSKRYNAKKHDFAVHKMPVSTPSSAGKPRWYSFLFGISKFSPEVDLRNIKNRQRSLRGRCHPKLWSSSLKCQHEDKKKGSRIGDGLIRVLSCGGNQHPNTMIVASITSSSHAVQETD